MSETIRFWLFFAILNSFYFLPRFLLEIFNVQFFPLRVFAHGTPGERLRHLLIRPNYDLFRVSVDLFVLIFAYALLLREYIGILPYVVFAVGYVGGSLVYQVYYHAFHRIYHIDPVFFHDFLMLKTAGQIFIHAFGVKNLLIVTGAAIIGICGVLCMYYLISAASAVSFGPVSWILIGLMAAGSLYSVLHYSYSKYPQLTFQSQLQSFIRNLIMSKRSRRSVANLTLKYMKQYNIDPSVRMQERPDLYFIVVESYGRIALEDPELQQQYFGYIHHLQQSLETQQWHSASGYTLSPVMGGASWISYTSMMYGLNVRNQGVYTTMLKNTYMAEYDSIFHWLKRQGYVTFRISSLGGYEKMEIPYDSYSRLYGIDHWIKYRDLEYSGAHYGFGPSPPDQYALWKGNAIADDMSAGRPKAVFFITQNSHTPYDSPLAPADDWTVLNDGSRDVEKPSAFWSRPKFDKYGDAIQYQLSFLTDFIVKSGRQQDIFVLIGDHQPPSISKAVHDFQTPMHVISRDTNFIRQWHAYGFQPGLVPASGAPVRQEALHWALMRSLISSYCQPNAPLPPFLAQGIPY